MHNVNVNVKEYKYNKLQSKRINKIKNNVYKKIIDVYKDIQRYKNYKSNVIVFKCAKLAYK